jgi:hypothetical protein
MIAASAQKPIDAEKKKFPIITKICVKLEKWTSPDQCWRSVLVLSDIAA